MARTGRKAAVCVLLLLEALDDHRESRKGSKTRAWIRKRNTLGMFNLLQELGAEDTKGGTRKQGK